MIKDITDGSPWTVFSTPAKVQDFSRNSAQQTQLDWQWSQYLLGSTQTAILGNPFSSVNDQNRSFYVNPMAQPVPNGLVPVPITWVAFPNRLAAFFASTSTPSQLQLTPLQLCELADYGYVKSMPVFARGIPDVPTTLCPAIDWTGKRGSFTPPGPRGWLDEYCELCVTRDQNNNITKVVFTCENPEYYFSLWRVDPRRVLELYQELANPAVQMSDLQLRDANNNVIIDPVTGAPAYDPLNQWNTGTQALPTMGGAMHLTSPPNTVGAEIYLAAAATIARSAASSSNQNTLICCTAYGRPFRNSDPHIGFTVNQSVNNPPNNNVATLANPIGLYIQQPLATVWDTFKMPAGSGTFSAQDCWKMIRGLDMTQAKVTYDQMLHIEFSMPPALAARGLTVSDMTINGLPITFGSQIMQQFKIGLAALLWPTQMAQRAQPCPPRQPAPTVPALAQVSGLLGTNVMNGYDAPKWDNYPPPALPPIIQQGTSVHGLTLQVLDALEGVTFVAPPGVTITLTGPPSMADGTYPVSVTVSATATPGPVAIQAINPGQAPGPAQTNIMVVEPAPSAKALTSAIGRKRNPIHHR